MKNRISLIFAAIVLVALVGVVLVQSSAKRQANVTTARQQRPVAAVTLETGRKAMQNRLARLQQATPEQWAALTARRPALHVSLDEARANAQKWVEWIGAVTPEQWDRIPARQKRIAYNRMMVTTPEAFIAAQKAGRTVTLKNAQTFVQAQAAKLDAATPEQWNALLQRNKATAPTLEQAKANVKKWSEFMSSMNEEQWNALLKQQPKLPNRRAGLRVLVTTTPDQLFKTAPAATPAT